MACKDCKHCEKKGLLVLPLRYSAVVSESAGALAAIPKLPGKLGAGVTDIALEHARYGVRMVREGYVYMLTERQGVKSWEGHMVLSSGQLVLFDAMDPPQIKPEPLCNRDQTSMHAYMLGIRNAQDVPNAWLLFNPTALTGEKLNDYRAHVDAYTAAGRMQHFSPAGWWAKQTEQQHTLLADELQGNVVEYLLYHQQGAAVSSDLGMAMNAQLFPPINAAYGGAPPDEKGQYPGVLGQIHTTLRRNGGAAFVLHDAIGITQELNDFRNAAIDPIRPWLAKTHPKSGATHERMLHVAGAVNDIRTALEQGYAARNVRAIEQQFEDTEHFVEMRRRHERALRAAGRIEEADAVAKEIARTEALREQRRKQAIEHAKTNTAKAWEKYADELEGIDTFEKQFSAQAAHYDKLLETRVDDHLAWLTSAQMLTALRAFDKTHPHNGQQFQDEMGLAMHGMNYTVAGTERILAWLRDIGIGEDNLLLRGICSNQKPIEDATRKAMAAAKGDAQAEGLDMVAMLDAIQSRFKDATDAFDKAQTAVDTHKAAFKTNYPGMGFALTTMVGQGIFKFGIKGGQSWLARLYIGLFAASIGKLNSKIQLSDLAHAGTEKLPSEKRSRGQATRRAREAIEREIAKGPGGDLFKLRVAGVLTLIEAWGLYAKARGMDGSTRTHLELVAASLGLTVAAFEGFAAGLEFVGKNTSKYTAAHRGAAIVGGGIKIFAGVTVGFAGAVGAWYDFADAEVAKRDGRHLLVFALRARGTAQGIGAVFGAAFAFAHTGPAWEFLTRYLARKGLHTGTTTLLGELATWLGAAARVAMIARVLASVTWVGLGITIAIWLFADDALENWCQRSSFRKGARPGEKTYADEAEELKALYLAFDEVK